jgi:tRNA 2-selenouridine synthase
VLGGRTGSGKTALLHALKDLGEQVLDLEGLAEHMGSAFGRVGQARPQPSNEMFENLVALAWRRADTSRALWVEHEGRHVGSCLVPARLFSCLRAPELLVLLNVPRAARVRHLVAMYATQGAEPEAFTETLGGSEAVTEAVSAAVGAVDAPGGKAVSAAVGASTVAELASAIESLSKRRGGAATAAALEQLARGDYAAVADSALEYYDALYDEYARSSRRHHVLEVSCDEAGRAADATRVLAAVQEWRVESNVKSITRGLRRVV